MDRFYLNASTRREVERHVQPRRFNPRLDGATSVFPVGLAELALEHLARILSRQRFVKRDDLGHLETGQVLANVSTNIVGAQGHSLVEFDRGRDRFAVLVVGIPKTAQSATPVSFKRQASISIDRC